MQPADPRPDDERIGRIWDAMLDHDVSERGAEDPAPSVADVIRRLNAVDDAPAPDPGMAARIWEDLLGRAEQIPAPATILPVSANGHAPLRVLAAPIAVHPVLGTRRRVGGAVAAVVRGAGIGAVAGMGAGLVAIGLGARVAMRVTALTAGPEARGRLTDNGERVGQITLDGSLFLLFSGIALGLFGGILYAAVRPWLPWTGWRRGLVFGLLLWATFAGAVMQDGTNPDYHRFGSVGLNIGLFCALPVLFGLLAAPLADWLERRVARWPQRGRPSIRDYARMLGLGLPALLGLVAVVTAVGVGVPAFGETGPVDLLAAGRYQVLLVAIVARAAVAATAGRFDRPADLVPHRRTALVTYGALAVPVLAGLALTVRAIERVLSANG